LKNITFNPLVHGFAKERIVPTLQNPLYWGWVNDNEAAKLAGICGAAGLFSNATDLLSIGEMLKNGGKWKGKQMIKTATIKRFAWYMEPGHVRSMGWQKPPGNRRLKSIAPLKASKTAFGHSGYTGTLFWVDPQKNLVVIFLSNVTYPDDALSDFKKNAGYKSVLQLAYNLL
jgi:CubicO group peptidase (beta-lactamase class C family)